jgi:TolA-binding protein/DNA-binding beta-propeller fold protein YncE
MTRSFQHAAGACLVVASLSAVLIAQGPGTPEEFARRQYDSGLEFMRAGKTTEALKDFQAVVDGYPNSSVADDAMLSIARYQLEVTHDAPTAQATAESLVKKYPGSDSVPSAYVVAGQAMVARGLTPANIDAALANFDRVPRLFPGSEGVAPALYAGGDTLRRLGRCPEALDRFDQVVMEYPRTTWASLARLGAGACLAATGRPFDGMAALQRAVNAFPNSPQAATARAWNSILYRLYVRPPAQPSYVSANRAIAGPGGKLKNVNGLAIAPDGSLAVSHRMGVTVMDAKGVPARSVGSGEARGIAIDSVGKVVLVQKAVMQQEGPTGQPATLLTLTIPSGSGPASVLDEMAAVGVLSTGERVVADRDRRGVFRFDPAGKFVGPFAAVRANRLAVGPGDLVALLDRDAKAISVFDRGGKPATRLQPRGAGYELKDPVDIAYDSMGHLYVLEKAIVAVFAPDGHLVTAFSAPDRNAGGFKDASALALDDAGRLYIYDESAEKVLVYQ